MTTSTEPTTDKPARTPAIDRESLLYGAIGLTLLTCSLAIVAWGQDNNWQFGHLSLYQVFPVLGLLAFSIMWSQYVMEAIKNYTGNEGAITNYFKATSLMVLALIILHPGILIAQRYKDGYGLPPGSYDSYVAPNEQWIVMLGSFSLLMFLAFEFKRFYGNKPWWKYVILLNDVAIVAILYHGLQLGQDLSRQGWFQKLWYVYGAILIAVLAYKYYYRRTKRLQPA